MKALHVISGISPMSGGPTRSVKGLCRALSKAGVDVSLLVLHGDDEFDNPCGVKVIYKEMPDFKCYKIVHLHGLWDPMLHVVAKACRRAGVKYIISPRGMLDPWALSIKKWKKRIALTLYQRKDLNGAVAFHVTAQKELESVKAAGFLQPCIVVPNAVDLPEEMPEREVNRRSKTALFLSRLHPGKGLITLAEAWARVNPKGWRMKVVGPDSYGHKKDVISVLNKFGILDKWEFVDTLDDRQKWVAYRSADLLIHPSVSENFGITIAEGLAAGLPVICTKGTPWREVETCNCGWWIDRGVEPLIKALIEATKISDVTREQMGSNGAELISEKYMWASIAEKMKSMYMGIVAEE